MSGENFRGDMSRSPCSLYLVNTQTHRDRQLLTGYTISSASWAKIHANIYVQTQWPSMAHDSSPTSTHRCCILKRLVSFFILHSVI